MPKYRVTAERIERWTWEIEARNPANAMEGWGSDDSGTRPSGWMGFDEGRGGAEVVSLRAEEV